MTEGERCDPVHVSRPQLFSAPDRPPLSFLPNSETGNPSNSIIRNALVVGQGLNAGTFDSPNSLCHHIGHPIG
jgi:hypothetical protein